MAESRAMVALHKKQFGRGPVRAQSHLAGRNTLVCILEDAMLPAEKQLRDLGGGLRVREARIAFQVAAEAEFVNLIEQVVRRKVRAFASAVDPNAGIVYEIFTFEAEDNRDDDTAAVALDPPAASATSRRTGVSASTLTTLAVSEPSRNGGPGR